MTYYKNNSLTVFISVQFVSAELLDEAAEFGLGLRVLAAREPVGDPPDVGKDPMDRGGCPATAGGHAPELRGPLFALFGLGRGGGRSVPRRARVGDSPFPP